MCLRGGRRMTKDKFHQKKIQWEHLVAETSKRFPERKDEFNTSSHINVDRLYYQEHDENYLEKLGFPGQYPFTRGIQPTMYRGRFWTMRQYAGFGSAKETHKRCRDLVGQGQTGLSVAFDLPTQIGYDSDDPMSEGEVGKVGVAIDSLADMEELFEQSSLGKESTTMTNKASAARLVCMNVAVSEKLGLPVEQITGTIQNDILKEYIAR